MDALNTEEFKIQLADFSSLCRICLSREDLMTLENTNYLDTIKQISNIGKDEVDEDKLPSNICERCVAKIEDITSFIILSENSHMLFKQVLQDRNQESINDFEFITVHTDYSDSESEFLKENSNRKKRKRSPTVKKVHCKKQQLKLCTICSQSFTSKKKFITHMRLNPECTVKSHKCNVCEKSFFTEFKLKDHMRCHSGEEPYKCEVCSKTFRYAQNLRRHDNIVHKGLKPFKCEICGKEFSRLITKKEHMSKHTGKQPFSCQYCEANFHYYAQYFAHSYLHKLSRGEVNNPTFMVFEDEESKIVSVECTICMKEIIPATVFRHSHNGKSKRMLGIPRPNNFLCTICGKSFLREIQLNSHSLVHTDLKPYECDRCDKRFRHKSTLKTHLLLHDGVKPFSCHLCKCSFSQRQHLKQHLSIHTGDKPFVCNWCGKKFSAKSNLTVHKRLHTGETPFKCPICQKGYCDSTSMKKHLKSQHRSIVVDKKNLTKVILIDAKGNLIE